MRRSLYALVSLAALSLGLYALAEGQPEVAAVSTSGTSARSAKLSVGWKWVTCTVDTHYQTGNDAVVATTSDFTIPANSAHTVLITPVERYIAFILGGGSGSCTIYAQTPGTGFPQPRASRAAPHPATADPLTLNNLTVGRITTDAGSGAAIVLGSDKICETAACTAALTVGSPSSAFSGQLTVGTNAINQLVLFGSSGAPSISTAGGADVSISLQPAGGGALQVEGDAGVTGQMGVTGTLAVGGAATFGKAVNAAAVDAGEVISPKHCVGPSCAANLTLSGATIVSNVAQQAPTVTGTGFVQSLGGFGNTGAAGDCTGALSSMCINDPQGLAISNGSATVITMSTDGGGSATFAGSVSAPLFDGGIVHLRTTTGNPTCSGELSDPNLGQFRFQPSTATEGISYLCTGRGWVPFPMPPVLSATFTASGSITDFWGSPPLVSPSGTPGPGGQVAGCGVTVTASGSGGAGVAFFPEWHDGDGGTPVRLCQVDLACASAEGRYEKISCGNDGGWGPRFGGTGYVDLSRSDDGGTCGTFPSGSISCSYQFLLPTLPL